MKRLTVFAVVAVGAAMLLCGCVNGDLDCENAQWIYTVKRDDTLWSIAEKTYGYGVFWVYIANANKIMIDRPLLVGQKIVVPCVERSPRGRPIPPKKCKPRRIR